MKSNPNFCEFDLEILDPDDPTEFVLKYHTLEAPAQQLARWENQGDLIGIVMAHKEKRMFMLMAYNFSRHKYFATGYYPHRLDKRPGQEVSITQSHNLVLLSIPLLCSGIGMVLLPIGLYLNAMKSGQYRVLNPNNFRTTTARRIAAWITLNRRLIGGGNHALDPTI